MIKTKTVETREEFDAEGRLVNRTVTETEETDDSPVRYTHTSAPYVPYVPFAPDYTGFPYGTKTNITCKEDKI